MDLAPSEATDIGKQIKVRRRHQEKSTKVKNSAPLPHISPRVATKPSIANATRKTVRTPFVQRWRNKQEELTDKDRIGEIDRQLQTVRALPRHSKYAQHRLRVLEKAKQLLEIGSERNQHDQEELQRLLAVLSL
jgi:hypothetical protein